MKALDAAFRLLCTPRKPFTLPQSNDRLRFFIGPHDALKMLPGRQWQATVTDLDTGTRYTLQSAPCTEPACYCDAVVIKTEPHSA